VGDDQRYPFLYFGGLIQRFLKSVSKAKGMSGKHLTGTVIYGYRWDEKREHWLVDEEAAAVVQRIFAMTLAGYGPYQSATRLAADKIEIPAVILPVTARV
jgi:site-specific DNA recombinase